MSGRGLISREHVLQLLREHADGRLSEPEAATVRDMIFFVEREPRCAERSLAEGHLTGSAWIVDIDRRQALLTHHRKLGKWLQPGGHADGEFDLLAVARREAEEETGLRRLRVLTPRLFDVDKHWIPSRGAESGHWHYDLRFCFEADPTEPLIVTDESHALAWVALDQLATVNPEESLLRMARKTRASASALD